MLEAFFVGLQYVLPQKLLTRWFGFWAAQEIPWVKNCLILNFIKVYKVNLTEAEREHANDYKSFNDFFTRKLKATARPIKLQAQSFTSPADGYLSEMGDIQQGKMIQAKGKTFTVNALLGSDPLATHFLQGSYATVYLSPKDYHRVHMPCDGKLVKMVHIPGSLFSVNQTTATAVTDLFAINERVVCFFETHMGLVAVVMVGAMIVGSIHLAWYGEVNAHHFAAKSAIGVYEYDDVVLKQGEEMGFFQLGSTAIVLSERGFVIDHRFSGNDRDIKMGESLALLK